MSANLIDVGHRSWARLRRIRVAKRVATHTSGVVSTSIAILFAIGVYLSIQHWDWLSGDESGSTTIRNLALVVAGIMALILAVWRSRIADRQATIAQSGLLDERYRQGTEMLGSDLLSVRLGGIYILRNLAEDHPDQHLIRVMESLCAFIRHPGTYDGIELEGDVGHAAAQANPRGHVHGRPRLREDVQAAITAIGFRGQIGLAIEADTNSVLDLNGADLSFASLTGANLAQANLSHTILHRAALGDWRDLYIPSSTERSIPILVPIKGNTRIFGPEGEVRHHVLYKNPTNLSGANLSYADLTYAKLKHVNLSGGRLNEANLSNADLAHANLSGANLFEAIFSSAILDGADMTDVSDTRGTDFSRASLRAAILCGANLSGAHFKDSDFSSATLVEDDGQKPVVGLTQEQLDQARPIIPGNYPDMTGVVDDSTGEQLAFGKVKM